MPEPTLQDVLKPKSDPTLRDLLAPLFRRKRLFALSFLGVMLGTAVAAYVFTNTHKASMEILVNAERIDPTVTSESTQGQASAPPVSDSDIGSEVELLKSPDLLQAVVTSTGLQDRERQSLSAYLHRGADNAWFVARATEHLGAKLDIQALPKTNLIEVSYKSGNPQLAYHVLQALAKLYLAQHLAVHRPQGSYAFFVSQAEKYQQALADSEARLAEFTKTTGIAAPDVQRTQMAQQAVSSEAALQSDQQAIAANQHRIDDERERMKLVPDRSMTAQATDSAQALMQQLQADLLAAQIKKSQLLMKYDPSYPLVQEADQEIAQTQAAITSAAKQQYVNQITDRDPTFELMREDIARTQADLASHRASAAALEKSIHSLQMQMVALDQKALKQADLSREVKANEANYLLYVSKREQERTSDALDEKRISNVAIAVPPVVPILPVVGPVLVVLAGMVLGVFVSTGTTFVAEYLDPSIRTPSEVTEVLRIPVLASVPKQSA